MAVSENRVRLGKARSRTTYGGSFTSDIFSTNISASRYSSALTHDQKTALAGQIARACAVFCVDEVVVYEDGKSPTGPPEADGYCGFAHPGYFLFHLLSYLESPPQLRKKLFPMHSDLRSAGALPSLDMPHHLRSDEWCIYREGITVGGSRTRDGGLGTLIDCGLAEPVTIPVELESGIRVTVRLEDQNSTHKLGANEANAVSPDEPREAAGYYWGYNVRSASSLSNVFAECPFDGGYDVGIGTSERGAPLSSLFDDQKGSLPIYPSWNHLLVVFGGPAGLEVAFANDTALGDAGVTAASDCFDHWINLVVGQGSRTIRSEEALWIGLMGLKPLIDARAAI